MDDFQLRFNVNWILEESCERCIKDFGDLSRLSSPMKSEGLDLELEELILVEPDEDSLIELMEVKLTLNIEADKDELFWEQRARVNWLKSRD
ncbi:hypothetical protein EPI10_020778 [Gossypium australe]|uniref:Uncharacterized protein n=1 Tax=Gossypium australe TaxID=47621 RepID=A0A5B6WG89_9ROSI|nr:hypothetical protein EPI10_020778 [Gossypium australe]